jgi:hypothetical protein
MVEKKVLVVSEENLPVQAGPFELAQSFLANGGSIDNLEKMLALQEKYDAMQAKKAYTKAMALFKADPPVIMKDKKVGYKGKKPGSGTTSYSHASLGNVASKIGKAMGKYGLSAAWPLDQTEKGVKVTCTITHELGHSESTSLFAASDNTGNKNSIQAIGSTISYLERYTILALTGLATEDQDDDGQASESIKCLSEEQCIEIRETIESIKGLTEKEFLKMAGCETVEEIHAANFGKAKAALKARSKNAN